MEAHSPMYLHDSVVRPPLRHMSSTSERVEETLPSSIMSKRGEDFPEGSLDDIPWPTFHFFFSLGNKSVRHASHSQGPELNTLLQCAV